MVRLTRRQQYRPQTPLQHEARLFNWAYFQTQGGRAALGDLIALKEYIDEETYQDLYKKLSEAFGLIRDVSNTLREIQFSRLRARKWHELNAIPEHQAQESSRNSS